MSTPRKVLIWFIKKSSLGKKALSALSPKASSNYSDGILTQLSDINANILVDPETRSAFKSQKNRAQPTAFHPVHRGHARSSGSIFHLNSLPIPLKAPGCSPALGFCPQPPHNQQLCPWRSCRRSAPARHNNFGSVLV